MREDEMVGWHHRLNGHGFGWTLGVGNGQGGLVCCGSWGHKELDTTERLHSHFHFTPWQEVMTNLDSILKKQRHYFANKGLSSQGYDFSSSQVCM